MYVVRLGCAPIYYSLVRNITLVFYITVPLLSRGAVLSLKHSYAHMLHDSA